jgi:hypothetical protein
LKKIVQNGQHFAPQLPQEKRQQRRALWQKAVRSVIDFYRSPV